MSPSRELAPMEGAKEVPWPASLNKMGVLLGYRRAAGWRAARIVLLGLPVATYDYDLWIHFDDIDKLNDAFGVAKRLRLTEFQGRAGGQTF